MTLPSDLLSKIESVLADDTDDFEQLARTAGLDPAVDFRRVCLKGIDLSNCDLTAFDFYESDLRGANLSQATIRQGALRRAATAGENLEGIKEIPSEANEDKSVISSEGNVPDLSDFPFEILEAIARSLGKSVDALVDADLKLVKELDLNGTQGADLTPLAGLASLQRLDLIGTQVTEEQKQALKKALPDLTISD